MRAYFPRVICEKISSESFIVILQYEHFQKVKLFCNKSIGQTNKFHGFENDGHTVQTVWVTL